jgi:hypothetical protein
LNFVSRFVVGERLAIEAAGLDVTVRFGAARSNGG